MSQKTTDPRAEYPLGRGISVGKALAIDLTLNDFDRDCYEDGP